MPTKPAPSASAPSRPGSPLAIKLLVVDDDQDVHLVTNLALRDFEYEGQRLEILDSYSSAQTRELFLAHPDIAVVLLDVVMESKDSGLRLVEWIRQTVGNHQVRIILRTGHPGDAPEHEVIRRYDINDYKVKTELTQQRLQITLYSALRSWRGLLTIRRNEDLLQAVLKAGSRLFESASLESFLASIESQVGDLSSTPQEPPSGSMMVSRQDGSATIVAASGRFRPLALEDFDLRPECSELKQALETVGSDSVGVLSSGVVIFSAPGADDHRSFVYVECHPSTLDLERLRLVMTHFSLAFANFQLLQYVKGLQDDLLFTVSDIVERHYHETASHVRRVSTVMARFAQVLGWKPERVETIRVASILHDVGKIGVPEFILKKPGPLTPEERQPMERHTVIGHEMLSRSRLPLFKVAATIARSHHENWDGSGYPDGLRGEQIPLEARMMALVDVFDALRSPRVYKPSWPLARVRQELLALGGQKFDPDLVPIFLRHLDEWDAANPRERTDEDSKIV